MNEVVLHRGSDPHLINIDCYINDQLLTNAYVSYENLSIVCLFREILIM